MSSSSSPSLPSSSSSSSLPARKIFSDADLQHFIRSPAYTELIQFVQAMGQSCAIPDDENDANNNDGADADAVPSGGCGIVSSFGRYLSPGMACLLGCLEGMHETWLEEVPPIHNPQQRFGNPAFTEWHSNRLSKRSEQMIQSIFKCRDGYASSDDNRVVEGREGGEDKMTILQSCYEEGKQSALTTPPTSTVASSNGNDDDEDGTGDIILELCSYWHQSFGHPIRLDYGTGHECCFMVFLMGLYKHGVFFWKDSNDNNNNNSSSAVDIKRTLKACGLATWHAYLQITRDLQTQYRLEPAGSHGVWGLDDYYCLSFYLGANQLIPTSFCPSDIHHPPTNNSNRSFFLYFDCIQFIRRVKSSAPFHETSPMLYDISNTVPTWQKVASGLLKLFQGEVLQKRPVVQHLVFGKTVLRASWETSGTQANVELPTETLFRTSAMMDMHPGAVGMGSRHPPMSAPTPTGTGTGTAAARPPPPPSSSGSVVTRAPWAK